MTREIFVVFLSVLVLSPLTAHARETEHFYSAEEAAQSELGKERLFGIPFYLKGQEHPSTKESLFEVETEQSTRGVFRSDKASCQVAFLSAIRELQSQAEAKGGDAIIDIVSVTKGKQTESPDQFRCIAGATVVHVGLKGTIVKLGE